MALQVVITGFSTTMFKDQRQAAFRCTQPDFTRMCWGVTTMQVNIASDKNNRRWGCTSCVDALLSNIRIFSMHSEVLGVLTLLLASHQLTAPFMACSRCWFYDRAVSYSYVNELGAQGNGSAVGRYREMGHGNVRKESSRRRVEEKEDMKHMSSCPGFPPMFPKRWEGRRVPAYGSLYWARQWGMPGAGRQGVLPVGRGRAEGNEHWEGKTW